jgi:hypothetical protein
VQGLAFFDELAFDVGTTYCTAQTNSSGCVPKIASSAIVPASLTHASGFTISATNVLAGKIGILFYGRGRNAVPFQGGTLCVQPPVQRTPPASSGGTVACTGQFALDFNAWIASGADPSLSAGDRIDAQWWSRDPAAVSTTNLTNAIELEIAP